LLKNHSLSRYGGLETKQKSLGYVFVWICAGMDPAWSGRGGGGGGGGGGGALPALVINLLHYCKV
jgi:hypothetical protein